MFLDLFFLAPYHGKGCCDGVCGHLKNCAKTEILNRESLVMARTTIGTHVALATWAWEKYEGDKAKKADRDTDEYVFYVLSSVVDSKLHESAELGAVIDVGAVADGEGHIDYELTVHYQDDWRWFWGGCEYERGDLRGRHSICSCAVCLDRDTVCNFSCPLLDFEGDEVQCWYTQPARGSDRDHEEENLLTAVMSFCEKSAEGQLVLVPVFKGGEQLRYLVRLGAKEQTGKGKSKAVERRKSEDGWPAHMKYSQSSPMLADGPHEGLEDISGLGVVLQGVWFEPHSTERGRYVPCARNTEVVVENVVPVVLDFVATEGENKAGFRLDDEEVSYIERLNLLRFT
jgi:hypothetical protein